MDQLEGIKNSLKNCTEDNFEKTKYAEKQLLTKVGWYQFLLFFQIDGFLILYISYSHCVP